MATPMLPLLFAGPVVLTLEKWLIAHAQPTALAHFNVGQQFASNLMMLYVPIGWALFPRLVAAWAHPALERAPFGGQSAWQYEEQDDTQRRPPGVVAFGTVSNKFSEVSRFVPRRDWQLCGH